MAALAAKGIVRNVFLPKHAQGEAGFVVLVNAERVHALWPDDSADPPAGWTVVSGPTGWDACLAYVDRHLTSGEAWGL